MDEIVKDFLIESNENLDRLDQELVKLESEPSSKELLASVFRTIHTIKGSCGFLGFARLEKLAHAGESLLSRLRDGKLTLERGNHQRVARHGGCGSSNARRDSGLWPGRRRRLCASHRTAGPPAGQRSQPSLCGGHCRVTRRSACQHSCARRRHRDDRDRLEPVLRRGCQQAQRKSRRKQDLADPAKIGGVLIETRSGAPRELVLALEQQEEGRTKTGEILVAQGAARPEDVPAAQRTLESRNPDAAVETIRVGVTLLDRLMNLVGELVLARNQLLQFSNSTQDAGFQAVSQRMNLIATELQEEVMKTRMQPIGNIWNKFPRTVRDLALSCGKEVRLEMEGQDTELDRTIIEAIKDPLTHLVRNSMDHGIEAPEARKRAGKDPTGNPDLARLPRRRAGQHRNLRRWRRTERATASGRRPSSAGCIPAQQAARMPDRDIFNLIFLPGFSTAERVTKVSGRGVGMDVVKTNVEKIGGTVDVQSTAGQGHDGAGQEFR